MALKPEWDEDGKTKLEIQYKDGEAFSSKAFYWHEERSEEVRVALEERRVRSLLGG